MLHGFFDPTRYSVELAYSLIIIFLCFLIYYKTKDIYDLTKHKGIQYFRNAFLFFGLSYASRFVLHLAKLGTIALDIMIPHGMLFPIILIPVGYLSTLALFFLAYSTIWKNMEYKHFLIISNGLAIIVSLLSFFTRSPLIMSLFQLGLIIITLFLVHKNHRKKKKKSNIKILYVLLAIFWMISLFIIGPKRLLPFEIKLLFQIFSVGLFMTIYYKVLKWTR